MHQISLVGSKITCAYIVNNASNRYLYLFMELTFYYSRNNKILFIFHGTLYTKRLSCLNFTKQ